MIGQPSLNKKFEFFENYVGEHNALTTTLQHDTSHFNFN